MSFNNIKEQVIKVMSNQLLKFIENELKYYPNIGCIKFYQDQEKTAELESIEKQLYKLIINNRYIILEKLGEGAQAHVFKVIDLNEKNSNK